MCELCRCVRQRAASRAITNLNLSNCRLTAIDPAVTELINLVRLDLSHNLFFPEVSHTAVDQGCQSFPSTMVDEWWGGCTQVPQELAGLTTLTWLDLCSNAGSAEAAAALGIRSEEGDKLVPKMRVTEQGRRFLLHFLALAALTLSVTEEEEAALAKFLSELQSGRKGPFELVLRDTQEFNPVEEAWW